MLKSPQNSQQNKGKDRLEIWRWIIQIYQVSLKLFCFEDSLINLFTWLIIKYLQGVWQDKIAGQCV